MTLKEILSILICSSMFISCAKKEDAAKTTDVVNATTIAANIAAVQTDMIPESFKNASKSRFAARSGDNDPCDEVSDEYQGLDRLFACQPILLRIYLSIAQQLTGMAAQLAGHLAGFINQVPDGSSNSFTDEDNNQMVFHINKTDALNYALLVENNSHPAMYINITDGNQYDLRFSLAHMPDAAGETGEVEVKINYQGLSSYDIKFAFVGQDCDANDVQAPQNIQVAIDKLGAIWVGGAHLYLPRWWGGTTTLTCASTPTSSTQVSLVTRFVGNDVAAKAEVALMKNSVTAINDDTMADYPLNDFFNIFEIPGVACGGTCPALTDFANPFCSLGASNTGEWNNNCSTFDAGVASGNFLNNNLIAPVDFPTYQVTIPTSL